MLSKCLPLLPAASEDTAPSWKGQALPGIALRVFVEECFALLREEQGSTSPSAAAHWRTVTAMCDVASALESVKNTPLLLNFLQLARCRAQVRLMLDFADDASSSSSSQSSTGQSAAPGGLLGLCKPLLGQLGTDMSVPTGVDLTPSSLKVLHSRLAYSAAKCFHALGR